jgi:membrane protein implicated in regulation of membrane protease activity
MAMFKTMAFVWLAVFIVMVVIEIATLGLTTIWFAGGALVALIISLFNPPVAVQIAVFIVVSVVLLIFTRPIAAKHFNKKMVATNVDSVPGEIGIVSVNIDNIAATGTVMIKGMEWTARTESDDLKIEKGAKVKVLRVEGVKVIVEPTAE